MKGKTKQAPVKEQDVKTNKKLTYECNCILKKVFQELRAARGEPHIQQLYNPAPSNHSNFLISYFQLAGYVKGHVAQQNTLE